MSYDFSNYYGVDPWNNIELNERPWYDPMLRDFYMRASVYSQHVKIKVDLNGPRARTIYFNDLIPPRPNIAAINARAMEATRLYTDSYQKQLTTARYGNGMALHRESEMFNYWQRMGGGTGFGLLPIIQQSLGQVIVDHLDLLARNAFLAHPYPTYGTAAGTGFSAVSGSTLMTTELVDKVWLKMRSRRKPFSAVSQPMPTGSELLCITTAGTIYDLKREVGVDGALAFVEVQKYQQGSPLISGELGMWRNMRFIENQMALLPNCGTVTAQTTIKAAVTPGDGAADPESVLVEGVRKVGQPASTHYIKVQDASGFSAGDLVTIHRVRKTDASDGHGVTNGVDYTDPMLQDVEIQSIDTSGGPGDHHIALKEPYMMTMENGKGLETDLGGTVYGYVTKGQHIHTAVVINPAADNAGVIAGVAQPPTIYTPRPIDDYESMYRIAYDFWLKYALWEPRAFEVLFLAGAHGIWGDVSH